MNPKNVNSGYQGPGRYQVSPGGYARPEVVRVDWQRGQAAVAEYLGWLAAGTVQGIIPVL